MTTDNHGYYYITKKHVIIFFITALVVAGGVFGYNQYRIAQYEKNRKEFILQTVKTIMMYSKITDRIREVWYGYIFNDEKYYYPETGQFYKEAYGGSEHYYYCSNASKAVEKKVEWCQSKIKPEIHEAYSDATRLYKEMTPPPGKYEESHKYVKQIYMCMCQLKELAESPIGSYIDYTSMCMACVDEYASALRGLELEANVGNQLDK